MNKFTKLTLSLALLSNLMPTDSQAEYYRFDRDRSAVEKASLENFGEAEALASQGYKLYKWDRPVNEFKFDNSLTPITTFNVQTFQEYRKPGSTYIFYRQQ